MRDPLDRRRRSLWSKGFLTRQSCRKMRPLFVPGEQKESSFFSTARSVAELLRVTSACAGRWVEALAWRGRVLVTVLRSPCSKRRRWRRVGRSRKILLIRQFVAWRSVISRDGDEACITDHIDRNFQPHGHDTPFPATKLRKAALVPAQCDDQTRPIAWLVIACGGGLFTLQRRRPSKLLPVCLNARTRAGWFRLSHWPTSSRNTARALVRTSAGFP